MSELDTYLELQHQWLKHTRIRKGSKVLVISPFTENQGGITFSFATGMMDSTVGATGTVIGIGRDVPKSWKGDADTEDGLLIDFGLETWWYPFFCLVRAE